MPMQTLVKSQPRFPAADRPGATPRATQFLAISTSGCRLVQQVATVAPHLELAVIEGESGVGKETLARVLHAQSAFARSNFFRCDVREWLLRDIDPEFLTGFTYLDRIDLLAAPGQALLLRVLKSLQSCPAGRLGLVASSETSLRDMALNGSFLPDLAFRFTAIRFSIPPLRERREDIAPLAALFLERLSERYRIPRFCFAPGTTARLLQHDWPGNARELFSVLESAVLESANGLIRAEDLPIVAAAVPLSHIRFQPPTVLNLDAVIQNHIRLVLDLNHGNKLKSARQLGISRSTLYRLLEVEAQPSR
ncbi:sigma 54-interacting transcriptional regulator [Telmatobacter sp. DSM 110680]|uniref:Sigma 54-interacting transcriptional regulator n=1 Tax=Telmatobacter sp. DSM 110680 TaxID=3036704 RepID=A0AAU7DRX7_9BACT